jgi:elongation factor Tu
LGSSEHNNQKLVEKVHMSDPSFRMTVQTIFPIPGRGIVAIGQVESGVLKVRDTIRIQRKDTSITAVVTGMEAYRKELHQAQKGDTIGALLGVVEINEVQPGDILVGFKEETG